METVESKTGNKSDILWCEYIASILETDSQQFETENDSYQPEGQMELPPCEYCDLDENLTESSFYPKSEVEPLQYFQEYFSHINSLLYEYGLVELAPIIKARSLAVPLKFHRDPKVQALNDFFILLRRFVSAKDTQKLCN